MSLLPVFFAAVMVLDAGWAMGAGPASESVRTAPAARQAPGRDESHAAARRRVFDARDRLKAGIVVLKALRDAQEALKAWNLARERGGETPVALAGGLCREVAMGALCEALPATFGRWERVEAARR